MAEAESRPEPPVLKRKGFQLCKDRFSVANIDRVDGSILREIFNPTGLGLGQALVWRITDKTFEKTFLKAQLRYYGISYPVFGTMHQLRDLLEVAAEQGRVSIHQRCIVHLSLLCLLLPSQCDMVPNSVLALQESMQDEYGPLLRKWEEDVKAWDANKQKRDDEAFEKCTTPSERANFDAKRFINYYFLTNGIPDRTKTPEPLALYGLKDKFGIFFASSEISGLSTTKGSFYGEHTVCIGWDSDKLHALAKEVAKEDERLQREKQDARWEKCMEMHHKYVSDLEKNASPRNDDTNASERPSFYLHRSRGSYIVKCDPVRDEWPNDAEKGFTLDISDKKGDVFIATFNFGIIRGTMILSGSEESLETYSAITTETLNFSDFSDSEDTRLDDPDAEKKAELKRTLQRAAIASKGTDIWSSKRRKVAPTQSRRVYFRIRGREAGEGEYFDTQSGHIDFLSDDCATFKGLAYWFPFFAKDVEFQGYKVSDKPLKLHRRWEDA